MSDGNNISEYKLMKQREKSLHANLDQHRKSHENKLKRMMKEPQRRAQEDAFAEAHANDTDEELFRYVKEQRRKLGKNMKRENTIGYVCITRRLGAWDTVMGMACKELRAEAEAEKAQAAAVEQPAVRN